MQKYLYSTVNYNYYFWESNTVARNDIACKKISSLMKENNSAIITEFVGLRAKMYALQTEG